MLSVTLARSMFPALSTAVPSITWLEPSVDTVIGVGHAAIPDPTSSHKKLTVTSVSLRPCVSAGGLPFAVIVGFDLSMFNATDAVAELPALSITVPDTISFAPWVAVVIGCGHDTTPAPASSHVNDTVTSVLFQPAAFADGDAVAVIVGARVSRLTVTEVVAVLPARSRAVPLTLWFAPSVDTMVSGGQYSTPDPASPHANVTVTSFLFQPAAFGGDDTNAVMVGGVLSMLTPNVTLAAFPARSVAVPRTT
jgi:hypothetical protein